jgi:hypothetical protein
VRSCLLSWGGSVVSAPATTSVLAPAIQHLAGAGGEETVLNLKGKERAITLVGEHSTMLPLTS